MAADLGPDSPGRRADPELGKSLNDAVSQLQRDGDVLRVAPHRLGSDIRRLGGAQRAKSPPGPDSINEATMVLNESKWGLDPTTPFPRRRTSSTSTRDEE